MTRRLNRALVRILGAAAAAAAVPQARMISFWRVAIFFSGTPILLAHPPLFSPPFTRPVLTPSEIALSPYPPAALSLLHKSRLHNSPTFLSFQAILDYMEKVEVQGLKHSAAQEKILLEQEAKKEQQQQLQQNGQRVAAGLVLGGGADGDSLASSWDAASLGGMSGAGAASVLSLGSLIPAAAAAATVRAGSR